MGEAKRRAKAITQIVPGTCSGCNLCCVVAAIPEIKKPPFQRCINVCATGCALHGTPAKPEVCRKFRCQYIAAHELGIEAAKAILPHPIEAGAYVSEASGHPIMYLDVDPTRPFLWRRSKLVPFLEAAMIAGYQVIVLDRGYAFSASTLRELRAIAAYDQVKRSRLQSPPASAEEAKHGRAA